VIGTHHRPAHDQPAQRGRQQDVHVRLALGAHPDPLDPLA
jgi:hypothetical protein